MRSIGVIFLLIVADGCGRPPVQKAIIPSLEPTPKVEPAAPTYLAYEEFKVGDVGEFHPNETWVFVKHLDEKFETAILSPPGSDTVGVCVPTFSTQIESKPSAADPDIKVIRLLGRWRVTARLPIAKGLTLFNLMPDNPRR